MADPGDSQERLAFEREKFQAEMRLRERELILKERDQTSWRNPFTVAVSAAALAWVGNAVITWWNGRLQRVLEREKGDQQRRLEASKAESERILEVIKTGDPERAVINLQFLLRVGLITTPEHVDKLKAHLASATPADAPALPAQGAELKSPARTYLVFFDWNSTTLTPVARQILAEVAKASKLVGPSIIEVNGYTDTSGSFDENMGLSKRRAQAVATELCHLHVPEELIRSEGFGEAEPLYEVGPGTREPKNRRVEIVFRP